MRRLTLFIGLGLLLLGVMQQYSSIQAEDTATKKTAPAGTEGTANPGFPVTGNRGASAEFDKSFNEWKELLAKLRQMQIQYQRAKGDEKAQLEKEYANQILQGRKMVAAMTETAKNAYSADSRDSSPAANFLIGVVFDNVREDNFELAQDISKFLLNKGMDNGPLYDQAGAAAFCTNHFDEAKSAWEHAAQKKTPSSPLTTKLQPLLTEYTKMWAKEEEIRNAEAKADDLPRVKFVTTQGEITIELFENEAPNTVANFVNLVEKKYYDGLKFHRVLENFMAQGGDPTGTGSGGPGYRIACECYQPNSRNHFRGTLSMAHAGKDTGGSQFFLTFLPTAHLNGKHTVFGRVIEGLDVLGKLQKIDPQRPVPGLTPDKIITATVIRKRAHPYVPKTLQ